MNNIIPIKEKLQLSDLFANNKINQIKWGNEFLEWPIEKRCDYAMKLASAMNEAANEMQKDRNRCLKVMKSAESQKEEAEQATIISKQTMIQVVLDSNEKTQKLELEIMKLNERLKVFE